MRRAACGKYKGQRTKDKAREERVKAESPNSDFVLSRFPLLSPLSLLLRPFLVLCTLHFTLCTLTSAALPLKRDSLPNGLIVLTYEDHRLPMADVALVCRSGAAFDPAGKAGTANLTANLIPKGMPGISADSIAAIAEFLGARLDAGADFDRSSLSMRILSKDLAAGLDLLSGSVLEPAFDPKEFRLAMDQAMADARQRYDYPQAVVSETFDRLVFGTHPFAWSGDGDTHTLRSVNRADLVKFHKTHYVPNNCFVVAVGDIDPAALLEQVKARFGNWQAGQVPELTVPEMPVPHGIKARLITRPDLNQTYIELGHPGIAVSDSDMLDTRLMSYILGGSPMSSRMGLAVREQGGLAYDVRCWFDRSKLRGAFHATVQTVRPKEAIELMLRDVHVMYDSGATAAEVMKAHNYYTGSFPLTYSSNRGKLMQVGALELFRFGLDWLERFPNDVRDVTLEEVNAAAKAHLQPGDYWMVIMGPVTKEDFPIPGIEWID